MRADCLMLRLAAIAAMLFAASVHAQLLPAKADSFYSNVLGQKRTIEVLLPQESEKDAAQRYETIYVLDGDWNERIVVDVVTFMRQVGFMPPVIVVSVPNFFDENGVNSRDHDLTPTVVADQPRSGGAAAFLSFLKTELVPYVNQHYPANGTNLIHGHSYGGLFLIYALLHEPALFDGYLILDPAMSWDNHALDATLESSLPGMPAKGKAIYIAGRNGMAFEGMGLASIEPIFQHKAPADLHWSLVAYPEETHDSLKLKATYDALKFAYQGYTTDTIEVVPNEGILLKGRPLLAHVGNQRFDIHYTTDGSIPDASSPKVGETIAISDPEKTTIKLLSNRGIYDRVIAQHLKSGAALLPDKRAASGTEKSWNYALYPASAWPRVGQAKAFHSGIADQGMDLTHAGRDDFAGLLEGNLVVPEDGYYILLVESTDQARLSLSGKVLVDVDASHGRREQAYVVPLRRGGYHARLEFRHPAAGSHVRLTVFQSREGESAWWRNRLVRISD
ncbi:MAG TPA: alpha/beta hydrolase-fold protein [Rhodanobacteraceae bacterium]|nr:alpha/beta hydrolase-fold protein [Rhodanobacteraceae bacterium]